MQKLKDYFKNNKIKPTPWAIKHGIPGPVICRALQGKNLSPKNAQKIAKALNGAVSEMELLYPNDPPAESDQPQNPETSANGAVNS
jgi:hypothetical protein